MVSPEFGIITNKRVIDGNVVYALKIAVKATLSSVMALGERLRKF